MTTEKAESGQIGHEKECDLATPESSLIQENTRGCRLAWSRLVDLGSIDSGSNPGSPIQISELVIVWLVYWRISVLLKKKPSSCRRLILFGVSMFD